VEETMAHISELGLLDYVAGKSDLTTEESEHLKDCEDCSEQALEMRHRIEESIPEQTNGEVRQESV
jgi:hypothetical protein